MASFTPDGALLEVSADVPPQLLIGGAVEMAAAQRRSHPIWFERVLAPPCLDDGHRAILVVRDQQVLERGTNGVLSHHRAAQILLTER